VNTYYICYDVNMKLLKSLLMIAGIFILIILAGGNLDKPTSTPGVDNIQPDQLAQCLTARGWKMYGTSWCSNCKNQRELFGSSFAYINEIDCDLRATVCQQANIKGYPVWEGPDGRQYPGGKYFEELASLSGCGATQTQEVTSLTSLPIVNSLPGIPILAIVYIAGIISFFAPCCLPLLPSYFSAITGFTLKDMYGLNFSKLRRRFFISSLFFALGFAIVYSLFGAVASTIGQLIQTNLPVLLKISGALFVVFGLVQLGVIKFRSLRFDYAWNVQRRLTGLGYITSTSTGVVSALVWIPCIGGILGAILLLAGRADSVAQGVFTLFIYALGIGTPFIIISLFFPQTMSFLQKHRNQLHIFSTVAGLIMIIFGIILVMDRYQEYIALFETIPFLNSK